MNSPTYIPCPGTFWFWLLYELPSKLSSLSSPIFFWCFSWPLSAFTFLTSPLPCPTDISPSTPNPELCHAAVSLSSFISLTSFLLHTHLLSPNSFVSFTDTPKHAHKHTLLPIPPPTTLNETHLQYHSIWWRTEKVAENNWKPCLLWEKRNEMKRESWSLTMVAWGVSLVLLCTGCLYLETPHASFFWWQVLESPLGSVFLQSTKQRKNENPSSHAKREH